RPEMPEIERGIDGIALRQHRRHRIAQELDVDHLPRPIAPRQLEEPFARPDMNPLRHPFAPLLLFVSPEGDRRSPLQYRHLVLRRGERRSPPTSAYPPVSAWNT